MHVNNSTLFRLIQFIIVDINAPLHRSGSHLSHKIILSQFTERRFKHDNRSIHLSLSKDLRRIAVIFIHSIKLGRQERILSIFERRRRFSVKVLTTHELENSIMISKQAPIDSKKERRTRSCSAAMKIRSGHYTDRYERSLHIDKDTSLARRES